MGRLANDSSVCLYSVSKVNVHRESNVKLLAHVFFNSEDNEHT